MYFFRSGTILQKKVKTKYNEIMRDRLSDLLNLCNAILDNNQINPCVIEHILVICCCSVHVYPGHSLAVFKNVVSQGEYKTFAINFLSELLEGTLFIEINVKQCESGGLRKLSENEFELERKIINSSCSGKIKNLIEIVMQSSDNKITKNTKELSTIKNEALKSAYDKLISGSIYLIGVFSCIMIIKKIIDNSIRKK